MLLVPEQTYSMFGKMAHSLLLDTNKKVKMPLILAITLWVVHSADKGAERCWVFDDKAKTCAINNPRNCPTNSRIQLCKTIF